MSDQKITLDNPAFAGRLQECSRRPTYERRPIVLQTRSRLIIADVLVTKPAENPPVTKKQVPTHSTKPEPAEYIPTAAFNNELILKTQVPEPKQTNRTGYGLTAMAVALFVFGLSVVYLQIKTNRHVAAQAKQLSIASDRGSSDSPPSESKPGNLGAYVVPQDQPRFLKIPKLSIDSRVFRLGVKSSGELQTPNNIYDSGWYQNSSKPGDAGGAILVDGHVHGPTQPGVFYGLKNLKPGDSIQIERGDGKISNFKVVKSQSYDADKVDMNAALVSVDPNKLGLNLITCTGSVNAKTNTYNQRLVVFAVAE